jgi:3-hydroxypropanoate dehydrogenase
MNINTDALFETARTHQQFLPKPVPLAMLHQLYERAKWPPTASNCSPLRIIFITTPEAKNQLLPCMAPGNVEKTRNAPVTALLGMDLDFPETLPYLFPHADAKSWFTGQPALIQEVALRNASLQGAYFMLAARSFGLDCGPMSGFDAAKVDAEFWKGTAIKTNFICNLGFGDAIALHPRGPRFTFEQACQIR